MTFIDIDFNKSPEKIELFLARPDKTIIGKLTEAYSKNLKLKLGGIHELNFKVPYEVDINHKLVRNPNVDNLRERYLLKVQIGNSHEWYIINRVTEAMDDAEDVKSVQAFLLAYELRDRVLRNYKNMPVEGETNTTPKNILETLQEVLSLTETNWTIDTVGGIDATISILYRSFEVSSQTVLNFIFDVAEKVKGLIVWDTENRKIFIKDAGKNLENIGVNRGLRISYGHYLKTLNKESDADEMVTRLKVFGGEDISIQEHNPTGQNYLEDFSYFLFPFARDANRNVISHSYYMSDDLSHAILDYKDKINSITGQFNDLLSQKSTLQAQLLALQTNTTDGLSKLETDLAIIQDNIDTINATRIAYESSRTYTKGALVYYNEAGYIAKGVTTGNSPTNSTYWDKLSTLKTNKQTEIDAKKVEINNKQQQINGISQQIVALQETVKVENNFTQAQIAERNNFIIEKEWTDTAYTNSKDLYESALKKFEELKKPQVVFSIDIVDFRQIVECQNDWTKLVLGDTITITYDRMGVDIEAKIIEIETNEDDASVKLTIANIKDLETNEEKIIKLLYGSISTSTTVDMNKLKWDGIDNVNNQVSQILNNAWDANKRTIMAGINEAVSISPRGITIQDPNDPLKYVVMQHGIIALTKDGGNTWKHAMTPDGIVGERIIGTIIAGQDLTIDASDSNGVKTFKVNSSGVEINGATLNITGGSNGVSINSTKGLEVLKSDSKSKITLNATDGIKIEQNTGTANSPVWVKKFYVDANGDLIAENMTTKNLLIQTGDPTPKTLIDASTKTIDFTGFNVINGKESVLKGINIKNSSGTTTFSVDTNGNVSISGNIVMNGGSISWSNVNAPSASQVGAVANNQTAVFNTLTNNGSLQGLFMSGGNLYINADYINGGTITGVTIKTKPSPSWAEMVSGGYFAIKNSFKTLFELRDASTNRNIVQLDNTGAELAIGVSAGIVTAFGDWDFASANVSGLSVPAVFG